ncbi:hypothetical protein HDU91_001438 [Kappamyces sp. JEL0680]|nr:hypothetical protein HDU91_001438 [Kappamyces sp. JEL0680]
MKVVLAEPQEWPTVYRFASTEIFAQEPSRPEYAFIEWEKRQGNCLVALNNDGHPLNETYRIHEPDILGFLYYEERDSDTRHVWLAGTRESARNSGVMSHLFDELSSGCHKTLTCNTYPDRFTAMPHFLQKKGFELVSADSSGKHRYRKHLQ